MGNEVATLQPHAGLAYTPKQYDLIRRTVAADCSPIEFDLFCEVARRVGLDPFRKQVYANVYSKNDADKRKLAIITSIDGYRSIAARNRNYRPNDEGTEFYQSDDVKSSANPLGLIRAVTKCWQFGIDGQWHAIAGEAYWDEFAVLKDDADEWEWIDTGEKWADTGKAKKRKVPKGGGELRRVPAEKWATMPHIMLGKCAEAQALRKGWPEDLSGIYTEEEMQRVRAADMTASEAADTFEKEKRLQITGSANSIFVQWTPADPLEAVPLGKFGDRAAEFVGKCAALPDLVGWEDTNRVALNDFWARMKTDALALKKIIADRKTALAKENT